MPLKTLQEKNNFYFAYLANKYWTNNSILVPKNKPELTEDFKKLTDIFGDNTHLFTSVYWFEIDILGEIKLPGEWNYCYINNKAYHLIKTKSDGEFLFKEGEKEEFREMFFYQLIYDDWANEFLENKINIVGSIIKTGDESKILENLHRTTPIIQNVNDLDEFDCKFGKEANKWRFLVPKEEFWENNSYYWLNPKTGQLIQKFLQTNYEGKFEENLEKLVFPFVAQETKVGNWKTAIMTSLQEYINKGLAIYDINKQNFDYASFIGRYRSDGNQEVYALTNTTGIKEAASTYVRGMWIKEIDLSGLTDIKEIQPNLQDLDPDIDRSWRNLSKKLVRKITGVSRDQEANISAQHKLLFENFFYTLINLMIIQNGGRLFTNINEEWNTWITGELPRDKYEEFGFFQNVEVTARENDWNQWTYRNRILNESYFWWFNFYKPGEYMTENRNQRNHVLYRNVSKFAGSMFMGAEKKNNPYLKKIDDKTYRTWKDDIKKSERIPDRHEGLTEANDGFDLYTDYYDGTENFDFSHSETMHKVRGLIHLDRYKLSENLGGKITDIKPGKGVLLIPDYENGAYVLGEYETNDITEGAFKKGGNNKVFAFSEILDHINPVRKYDFDKPSEQLLTGSQWDKVSHAMRLGTVIKRILLPPEEEHKQAKIRFKRWYKPDGGYWELTEHSYKIIYYVPKIPRWSWQIFVPANCEVDFQKILDKYNNVDNNNLAWINGNIKKVKGISNYENYNVPIFDQTKADYMTTMKFNEVPLRIRSNSIFIFVDIHPRESATEQDKKQIAEMVEELHTAFFRSPWRDGITYQSSNIPGNVKRLVYTPRADSDSTYFQTQINYWTMTNFRPYNEIWYGSRIIVKTKFEAAQEKKDSWYNSRQANNFFSFEWNNTNRDGMLIIPIAQTMDYGDKTNHNWKSTLTNLFILGQADRVEKTPNGIFNSEAIAFQDREGYKWDWRNTRGDWNRRYERQEALKNAAIFMKNLESKSVSYEDKNLENPKVFKPINYVINDVDKLRDFYDKQSHIIPDYIWKWIDPDSPISALHRLDTLKPGTDEEFLNYLKNHLKPKLEKAFNDLHTNLIKQPILLDLVGTNFLAMANYDNSKKWSFELIIKNNESVLVKEGRQKCDFINYKTDTDAAKAINSLAELNIYGHKIPLKERFTLNGSNIPVSCHIEKVPDRFQSPSDWFYVEIKTNTDFIRTQLEVPKEQTIRANISLHEKQRLFNEYIYNNADRFYEAQKYNLDKQQFYRDIRREEKYQYLNIAQDILGMSSNVLALKGIGMGGILGAAGGLFNLVGGIMSTAFRHSQATEARADRLEFGLKNFHMQGETMAQKHKSAEEANRLTLQNLANNNRYPEFNNAIIFEEVNKLINKSNVYLSRYSPKGDILQALKDHYDEYGFDIYLNNQSCTGVQDIVKQVQYLTIKQNLHPNSTIRNMIEQRLLTGIKVVD